MNERQKRLIEVYEHLRKYYGIHTKTGFAEALHYGRTSMSAAMNGDEKYLTDSLFKNICEAYRGVFNIDYLLTGEGQLLTIEEEVTNEELEKMVNPTPAPQAIDYTFLIEKAVEKATAYADKYIATLEKQVADKDKQIADLRSRVRELEMFINSQSFSKAIEKSPFPVGVADDGSVHILVDKG